MGYFNPSQTISGVTETPGPGPSGVTFDNTLSTPAAVFVTDGDISGATFTPTGTTVTPVSALVLLGIGLVALGVLAFSASLTLNLKLPEARLRWELRAQDAEQMRVHISEYC